MRRLPATLKVPSALMKRPYLNLFWLCALSSPLCAASIGAKSLLEVRLRHDLASYSSRAGSEVTATLVAPVKSGVDTLLPQGAVVRGQLVEVKAIGWGVKNLRASMRIDFDTVQLPDGSSLPIKSRLLAVENAREHIDQTGKIVGIRATAPMGHRLAGIARNVFIWDPLLQLVIAGSTAAVLTFPEAEIHYPAGTEMLLQLTEPLEVDTTWTTPLPRVATDGASREQLSNIIRAMTWRATTDNDRKPADIVNVVFLGEPEWVERAFSAAGWQLADPLTKKSGWMCFRSVAESRPYPAAPMSRMLLDEQFAKLSFSKSLSNYSKRHHLRIFSQAERWNGRPLMAAASTQDLGITLSFSNRRIIHVVDRNIDNERAKIVNDLVYTGCVDAAELVERPWIPAESKIGTGEMIRTDGSIAVIELNPCRTPLRTLDSSDPVRVSGGIGQKMSRRVFLTLGNDFTFNNPVYQAGLGLKFLWNRMLGREDRSQPARTSVVDGQSRSTDLAPPVPTAALPD